MDLKAFKAFTRLRFANPEDALRQIADLVREGCDDPAFINLLADHIDPDKRTTPFGTKFRLVRTTGKKSPPKEPDYDLREFLERHIDIFNDGEKAEAVKEEAGHRFGVGRSACTKALAVMRKWQKSDPEAFEMRKEAAYTLRAAGDPDFQPLWPDK